MRGKKTARNSEFETREEVEKANDKVSGRLKDLEALAREEGIEFGRSDLEKLDGRWNENKERGKGKTEGGKG